MAVTPLESTAFLKLYTIEHLYNCITDTIEAKSQRDLKKAQTLDP